MDGSGLREVPPRRDSTAENATASSRSAAESPSTDHAPSSSERARRPLLAAPPLAVRAPDPHRSVVVARVRCSAAPDRRRRPTALTIATGALSSPARPKSGAARGPWTPENSPTGVGHHNDSGVRNNPRVTGRGSTGSARPRCQLSAINRDGGDAEIRDALSDDWRVASPLLTRILGITEVLYHSKKWLAVVVLTSVALSVFGLSEAPIAVRLLTMPLVLVLWAPALVHWTLAVFAVPSAFKQGLDGK